MTSRNENTLFVLLVISLVCTNLLTLDWFPQPWVDEVSYADPSINYVMGHGFTSTSWASQARGEFWASNAPLHQYLLIPWAKIFGVSLLSIRCINLVYLLLGSVILWRLLRKTNFITGFIPKLLAIALLWLADTMSLIYRDGRPDAITILLAISVIYVFIVEVRYRTIWTITLGSLSLLAGIQLPPFVCIVLGFAFLVHENKKICFLFGIYYVIGVTIGLSLLLLFLYTQGSAYTFLTQTFASGFTMTGDIAQLAVYGDQKVSQRLWMRLTDLTNLRQLYFQNLSIIIGTIWLLLLLFYGLFRSNNPRKHEQIIFTLCYMCVPPFLLALGRYPFYYHWMGFLILWGGIFWMSGLFTIPIRVCTWMIAVFICVIGLPNDLINSSSTQNHRQEMITTFTKLQLKNSDWVYADHETYYAVKPVVEEVFLPSYSGGRGLPEFPESERNRINKLLIHVSTLESVKAKLGGEWELQERLDSSLALYSRK